MLFPIHFIYKYKELSYSTIYGHDLKNYIMCAILQPMVLNRKSGFPLSLEHSK